MGIIDVEGHPIHLLGGLLLYLPWFAWALIQANIDVARHILSPRLSISPCLIRVKASQKTHLGQVIYANSITLTPGTVAVDVEEGTIEVHALTRSAAEELMTGEMDRRVTHLENEG
jgi:multicomponent Na+:H+ antiporter subunit E